MCKKHPYPCRCNDKTPSLSVFYDLGPQEQLNLVLYQRISQYYVQQSNQLCTVNALTDWLCGNNSFCDPLQMNQTCKKCKK